VPYEYLPIDPSWVVFETAVEGTFIRAFGNKIRGSTPCHEGLRQVGIDISKPLKPQYRASDYESAMRVLHTHLFATLTEEAALRQMGNETTEGFYRTLLGSALAKVQPLIGPDRMLTRLPASITNSSNFMKAELKQRGPRDYQLHVWGSNFPWYVAGAVERAVAHTGVKPRLDIEELGKFEAWYGVKW